MPPSPILRSILYSPTAIPDGSSLPTLTGVALSDSPICVAASSRGVAGCESEGTGGGTRTWVPLLSPGKAMDSLSIHPLKKVNQRCRATHPSVGRCVQAHLSEERALAGREPG